jgi:cell wall-associated NlpC family hydrolase
MASARALFLCLLALLACAPAALAQDGGWTPPPGHEGYWTDDGQYVPPGATPTPAPTVAPAPTAVPTVAPPATTPTVPGSVARLRANGKAAIPRRAPQSVRAVLAAGNRIVGKPYKWGGGHAKLVDSGYDCSGTVSYALIRAGLLTAPLVSGTFAHWGAKGIGTWITIYANADHVYMEVAGLRLDTSAVSDPGGGDGPRWRPVIGHRRGFRTRHVLGL